VRPTDVPPYWLEWPRSTLLRPDKSCKSGRCVLRFSDRSTCFETATASSFGAETSLLRLRPLQGSTQRGLPNVRHPSLIPRARGSEDPFVEEPGPGAEAGNSHGVFCPFDVQARASSLHPGLPKPGTFRPQGFSPSRRFPPRSNARSYFIPVTSMGFYPSGSSPHRQVPNARRARIALLTFFLRTRR